jgi:Asp-tRNA(Asn)/Glu-tRNA(Gln) amidotransferase B subunit
MIEEDGREAKEIAQENGTLIAPQDESDALAKVAEACDSILQANPDKVRRMLAIMPYPFSWATPGDLFPLRSNPESPAQVQEYQGGKKRVLGWMVAQVLSQGPRGSLDPRLVNQYLSKKMQ